MAYISYNGISLPYSDLTDFQMEAVSDPSNTDRILTKFLIGASTVINKDFLTYFMAESGALLAPTAGQNPVAITQLIYQRLMERRKRLSLQFNGVEMIPQRQQGVTGYVDAMNGPVPLRCEILPMGCATNETFILTFKIEANYWLHQDNLDSANPNKNLPGNVVLYNRWTESVDIDDQNRTTKARRGKLMIRSDNVKGWIADQIRSSMAVVGQPPGRFIRKKSYYTVSEDGLGLSYEVVDQEVFRMPASPSFRSEGVYIEEGTRGDGKRIASCRVKLYGDNDTSQNELYRRSAAIVLVKLGAGGLGQDLQALDPNAKAQDAGFVLASRLAVGMWENWAEFMVTVMMPAKPQRLREGAMGGRTDLAMVPDAGAVPKYLTRGTASLLLQAAAYYDPSFTNTSLGPAEQTAGNAPLAALAGNVQLNRGVQPGREGTAP